MHIPIAGRRRRTLVAAALPVAVAAFALPATANAATIEHVGTGASGFVSYSADPGEANNIRVRFAGGSLVVDDQVPIRALSSDCRIDASGSGVCPGDAGLVLVFANDRGDTVQYSAPHKGAVFGGDGADTFLGGQRQAAPGRQIEPLGWDGKDRRNDFAEDTVSYRFATSRVDVRLHEAGAGISHDDGRPGDLEGIGEDIQVIEGSRFGDTLTGSSRNDFLRGGDGDDAVNAGAGSDIIDEGSTPNGADFLNGGSGINDAVSYGGRTSGVSISLDGVRNDGAPGERDDVRPGIEALKGSNFADTLTGDGLANSLVGFGGVDTLDGGEGSDEIIGGAGADTIFGRGGDDTVQAKDNEIDTISCGLGVDRINPDIGGAGQTDLFSGCEKLDPLGSLRLAPQAIGVKADGTARLTLSWRHPQGWRKLRAVTLRLTRNGAQVAEITVHPRGGRITDDGAVALVRGATRLTRRGKTVSARLAIRLDAALAGQTLKADVEATDRRGARQLERDAATIRVAR